MKLVKADYEHLEILAQMNLELIQDEGHDNPMNLAQLHSRMANWLEGEYSVALFEKNEKFIGYALWRIESEFVYLRQFFISRSERRNGFGSVIIQKLLSLYWIEKKVRLEVLIQNKSAREFWRSVGFYEYCVTMERRPSS